MYAIMYVVQDIQFWFTIHNYRGGCCALTTITSVVILASYNYVATH